MYLSMGNVLVNPKVGILFIDFEKPNRLRISTETSVMKDDPLISEYPEARFVVRVAIGLGPAAEGQKVPSGRNARCRPDRKCNQTAVKVKRYAGG
ncbi:pyridoxamine 5'-phosphate oxidase family protein [Variovorax sp. LjRoot290]|uniref:hypothetical protein n=1 Tax=unclassified Variovorax TaxID=663243 RepID=UPI003ECE6E85